jgi:hypothetical protein
MSTSSSSTTSLALWKLPRACSTKKLETAPRNGQEDQRPGQEDSGHLKARNHSHALSPGLHGRSCLSCHMQRECVRAMRGRVTSMESNWNAVQLQE